MSLELDEIKAYLRIDEDEDDTMLSSFLDAAKKYLENAGVKEDSNNSLYKLVVSMLVCNLYENRNIPDTDRSTNTQAFSLKSLITQLKCSQATDQGGDIK